MPDPQTCAICHKTIEGGAAATVTFGTRRLIACGTCAASVVGAAGLVRSATRGLFAAWLKKRGIGLDASGADADDDTRK